MEAVELTQRASMWSWFAKTIPTDIASTCVHCFREAGRYLYSMRICTACVFLVHAQAYFLCTRMIHRRGFSTSVLLILLFDSVVVSLTRLNDRVLGIDALKLSFYCTGTGSLTS